MWPWCFGTMSIEWTRTSPCMGRKEESITTPYPLSLLFCSYISSFCNYSSAAVIKSQPQILRQSNPPELHTPFHQSHIWHPHASEQHGGDLFQYNHTCMCFDTWNDTYTHAHTHKAEEMDGWKLTKATAWRTANGGCVHINNMSLNNKCEIFKNIN